MTSPRVCIATFPLYKTGVIPLRQLIDILLPLSSGMTLVTGNDGYAAFRDDPDLDVHGVAYREGHFFRYLQTHWRIARTLIAQRRNYDVVIFFTGGEGLPLASIALRLFRIPFAINLAEYTIAQRREWRYRLLRRFATVNFRAATTIIVYAPRLISAWGLERYAKKITVAHRHSLDGTRFRPVKPRAERAHDVGFIGRFTAEKGIEPFLAAVDGRRAFVGGDGPLRPLVDAAPSVIRAGWITRDELPGRLNDIVLLVMPSDTEGLPNIMLEAMACGTLVLATPVGAIPDIITDGETGFLMENNTPECIAENIERALQHPGGETIAKNARKLVETEFTFEIAQRRYAGALRSLMRV